MEKRKNEIENLKLNYGKEAGVLLSKIKAIENSEEYIILSSAYASGNCDGSVKKAYINIQNTLNSLKQEASALIEKGKRQSNMAKYAVNDLIDKNAKQAKLEKRQTGNIDVLTKANILRGLQGKKIY